MEVEGSGKVRLERLTAMAALDTKLILNVPNSELLGTERREPEGGRERGGQEEKREREREDYDQSYGLFHFFSSPCLLTD